VRKQPEFDARLFAGLNLAVADSGTAAWDLKYTFDFRGSIDALHDADQDGNAAPTAKLNWTPLPITPSLSKNSSVHSKFSTAAGAILAAMAAAVERLSLRQAESSTRRPKR
jgi:hypothetical protein